MSGSKTNLKDHERRHSEVADGLVEFYHPAAKSRT